MLAWDPPENQTDIAGYKVHYGNSSGNYDTIVDVGNQTETDTTTEAEIKSFHR
jgi:hypothetical protein